LRPTEALLRSAVGEVKRCCYRVTPSPEVLPAWNQSPRIVGVMTSVALKKSVYVVIGVFRKKSEGHQPETNRESGAWAIILSGSLHLDS